MQIKTSNHPGTPGHQTVTEFIKLKTPQETIQIGFTDQKVSGRAGLPSWIRLRLVRADSGFCVPEWLDLLELKKLSYIVVARLLQPVQRLLKKELIWTATEVPGTEVAEV